MLYLSNLILVDQLGHKMASEYQKKLATIIKETHERLRLDYRQYGCEEAWSRHIARVEDLQSYASSMQELAISHWNFNNQNSLGNVRCRIQWIKDQCYNYFLKNEKQKFYQREIDIINKLTLTQLNNNTTSEVRESTELSCGGHDNETSIKKIKLLDVGSCYNPFADDNIFDVTAIDLAPSNTKVLQCDFLSVKLNDKTKISAYDNRILELEKNSFDVCVFSLFLSYFPCPKQRFLCCEKAYDLLKDSGLLIIITPDSRHAHANAKIMKSWRFVLANLGFMRIKYEKLKHIHCIVFRKCIYKKTAVRWIELQQNVPKDDVLFSTYSSIYIPKDLQSEQFEECVKSDGEKFDESDLAATFNELPLTIN